MELRINPITILIDRLECMTIVTMHVSITRWNTSITHEDHDLVDGFGVLREVIPEGSRVVVASEVGRGMSLLGVNEVGKFGYFRG